MPAFPLTVDTARDANLRAERMLGHVAEDVVNTITPADTTGADEGLGRSVAMSRVSSVASVSALRDTVGVATGCLFIGTDNTIAA